MAVQDIRFTAQTQPFGGLTGYLHSLISAVSKWNDMRVTRKALARLSDRELEDIGLVRGDIDRVVAKHGF